MSDAMRDPSEQSQISVRFFRSRLHGLNMKKNLQEFEDGHSENFHGNYIQ